MRPRAAASQSLMNASETEVTIIQPSQNWLRLNVGEIWKYRDLLYLLVRRDFVTRYKQTLLGPLWFIVQPILMTVVFTVIFGKVAQIPTDGMPPILFYLCGLLGWNYFSQTVSMTSSTFTTNSHLFQKVYFPRIVIPLSVAFSNLFSLAIQIFTFAAFWIYFKSFTDAGTHIELQSTLFLFPLLIIQTALLGLGVGLWMSALTAKYRDLTHLNALIVQLWMYATPIIYPLSQVPEDKAWIVLLNPMAIVVETMKSMFLGSSDLSLLPLAQSFLISIALFFTGLLIFQRTERTFADTV